MYILLACYGVIMFCVTYEARQTQRVYVSIVDVRPRCHTFGFRSKTFEGVHQSLQVGIYMICQIQVMLEFGDHPQNLD